MRCDSAFLVRSVRLQADRDHGPAKAGHYVHVESAIGLPSGRPEGLHSFIGHYIQTSARSFTVTFAFLGLTTIVSSRSVAALLEASSVAVSARSSSSSF